MARRVVGILCRIIRRSMKESPAGNPGLLVTCTLPVGEVEAGLAAERERIPPRKLRKLGEDDRT